MSWVDWIPGGSAVKDFAHGDISKGVGHLFYGGPMEQGYNYFYGDPAKKVEAAYDEGMQRSQDSGTRIKDFLMGQQQQALGYYKPVQSMFNSAYGSQGLQPQQLPGGRR